MILDIKPVEQCVKSALLRHVVVGGKHVQDQALAEAARTNEEQEVTCLLQLLYVHRLVHIVKPLVAQLLEITDTVWYAFEYFAHKRLFCISVAKLKIIF